MNWMLSFVVNFFAFLDSPLLFLVWFFPLTCACVFSSSISSSLELVECKRSSVFIHTKALPSFFSLDAQPISLPQMNDLRDVGTTCHLTILLGDSSCQQEVFPLSQWSFHDSKVQMIALVIHVVLEIHLFCLINVFVGWWKEEGKEGIIHE